MRFTSVVATLAALAASANAYIYGISQTPTNFKTGESSTLSVTFETGSTKVLFYDLTVSFGLVAADKYTGPNVLGKPIFNVDLVKEGLQHTAPGNFTLEVPITAEDLFNGSGAYVLTAAVVRVTGNQNEMLYRADPFSYPFNATVA
ncbi:hypothetical protein AURDEDRAFT_186363 [Auricularia subglabra TFB-10046 SS5]|nr:hypothetical protein AURDEDRAFT_186363 [Auricularia subglabra TFB-10046 SS5]